MESVCDLVYQCLERWTERFDKNDYRLFWEGNYYDSDVHDYAELTNETFKILVDKCTIVLTKIDVKKYTKVIVYLPALIQLPIITLATHRIGAKLLITSALNEDVENFGVVLKEFDPEIIITVDGFWCGSKLKRSKCLIDEALSRYRNNCRHVIVIRHVTPNEGVPPPQKHFTAKRPYYLYKISMENGRDLWWSDLFVNTQSSSLSLSSSSLSDCKSVEEINTKTDLMYQAKCNKDGQLSLIGITHRELEDKIKQITKLIDPSGICFVMNSQDPFAGTIAMLATLYSSAQLLIFEGISSYPDYSRISQTIDKYQVKTLIIANNDLRDVLNNDEYAKMWNTATLSKLIVLGDENTANRADKVFGVQPEFISHPVE